MLSDAPRFRRIVAGLSLILAPLFLLVGTLMESRFPETRELLADITKRPVANEVSFAFGLYGFVLFVPAIMGLLHLLQKRAVALGHIAGVLLISGVVSFAFIAGTEALLYIAGADATLNQEALLAINDRIGRSAVYNIINMTEVIGCGVGSIVLAVALLRAKVIPGIFSLSLIVAVLVRSAFAGFYAPTILAEILYAISLWYIGYFVLSMSDDKWAHY